MKTPPKTCHDPSEARGKDSRPEGRGRLFVLSAPSGAGKSTLCRELRRRFPGLSYSVSHTTRAPRAGEIEGKDYFFISLEAFQERIRENRWAEWAEVHGNHYGTSADFIERMLDSGRHVLMDIDVQGALQIRRRYPDSVAIFIVPPSMEALRKRLVSRGTDLPRDIEGRLEAAGREMAFKDLYDHVLVNDRLEDTVARLAKILAGESIDPDRRMGAGCPR